MKKTMRTLLCLLLAIVAVVNLAAPAMAAVSPTTKSCADTYNGLNYTGKLVVTTSTVTSTMTYAGTSKIKTEVTANLYYELEDVSDSNLLVTTGTSKVTASVNNIFTYKGVSVAGDITFASGDYLVLAQRVNFLSAS